MQLMTHYLELRGCFGHVEEGQPVRVTLEELAEVLYCSTRNVKLLLKKMSEQSWIAWSPGRGRGNASELVFLRSIEEMVTKHIMELAGKGDYKGAIELIHRMEKGDALQDSFIDWIFSYFGYRENGPEEHSADTLRFPIFKPIVSLDPAHAFFAFDCNLLYQIFDTLVRYDQKKPDIEPHLAHYWEVSEDRLTWTFYLRKGVMFHHGREMTASDVRFSLLRIQQLGEASSQSWLTENIHAIEVMNRSTVVIRLKRPNALFLKQLAFVSMSVVPEEVCFGHEDLFARVPIGTGPFRLERSDEYTWRLRAFDRYFDVRPHLDQIEIWLLPKDLSDAGPNANLIQVLCGYTNGRQPIHLGKKGPEWHSIDQMILGCSLLTFNVNKPGPQQHLNFRKAVDLLLDRERMARELEGNREKPAVSFIPDAKPLAGVQLYDLEEARRLLEEMGYDGSAVHIYVYQPHQEDAQWISDQCAAAGIKIEIMILDETGMTELEHIRKADMILYQNVMESDYDLHVIETLQQSNSYVRAHLNGGLARSVDIEIAALLGEDDQRERIRKLDEMVEALQREKSFLFVLHRSFQTTYHASLKGVALNDLGWIDFRKLWFAPNMPINESGDGNAHGQ